MPWLLRSNYATREVRPRALVTDAGRGSAIAVIRSLGRAGWDVVAADSDAFSPGFHSRYARWRLRYPPPAEDSLATARAILQEVRRRSIDVLIPVTDDVIVPISAMRETFRRATHVAMPEPEALATVSSKMATLQLAEQLGVPVPRSQLVTGVEQARVAAAELGWPVVLKPLRSRTRSHGGGIQQHEVSYAHDGRQLAELMHLKGGQPILLQEYWVGEGQGLGLLLHDGQPLAAFQHRRLREVPLSGGASSFREGLPIDPTLFRHSVSLFSKLSYTGLAMAEFRVGPRGPCLMEINGRTWGSLPLAVKSGVDFPVLLARMCLGEAVRHDRPLGHYQVGLRSRSLVLEAAWVAAVLRGGPPSWPPIAGTC